MEYLVIQFLKAHWRTIAIGIAVLAVVIVIGMGLKALYDAGMQEGIDVTNKAWDAKYKKDVDALNLKIAQTENVSKVSVAEAYTLLHTANKRIDELTQQTEKDRAAYDKKMYTVSGKAVCESVESLYLGSAFSLRWNEINKEEIK